MEERRGGEPDFSFSLRPPPHMLSPFYSPFSPTRAFPNPSLPLSPQKTLPISSHFFLFLSFTLLFSKKRSATIMGFAHELDRARSASRPADWGGASKTASAHEKRRASTGRLPSTPSAWGFAWIRAPRLGFELRNPKIKVNSCRDRRRPHPQALGAPGLLAPRLGQGDRGWARG